MTSPADAAPRPVDAHCHFWQLARGDYGWLLEGAGGAGGSGDALAPIRRDFLPGDHPARDMRLVAVQAAATLDETRFLLALAAQHPRICAVVGWVDLSSPRAVADLHALAACPTFRGVRPMLQDIAQADWLLHAPRPEALAALNALGLRFDALVTERYLGALLQFARRQDGLPIVVDHAAKPRPGDPAALARWEGCMRQLAALPHVHCKLSGLLTELPPTMQPQAVRSWVGDIFGRLLDWFGPQRLIWGSDWPVLELAAGFEAWQALCLELTGALPTHERAAILGGNAARFYGLEALA